MGRALHSVVFWVLLAGAGFCEPARSSVELEYFGYAAVACDHDDPFDSGGRVDFSSEVAGFTNANQVCVTGDMALLASRLRATAALYTPIFFIEPVFFSQAGGVLSPNPDAGVLWELVQGAIGQSGVPASDLIFYLVDEPSHRGLPMVEVSRAAGMVRAAYPAARILMIAAYNGPGAPVIPAEIDYWGFDAYTIADPGQEQLYTQHLDQAAAQFLPHQKLVLVMDANHTPHHVAAGLSQADMAGVAWNYLRLARDRGDIAMILGYTWAGGIDNLQEMGVRNLPQSVQDAHRQIGLEILGR